MNVRRRFTSLFPLFAALLIASACSSRADYGESDQENQDVQASTPDAIPNAELTEWPVPWEDTRPRDPFVSPDGKVWFCGQAGNYIAYLDPETESFKRFELEERTNPHNLIIDSDGFIWYAGNLNAHIGRLDPSDGSIEKYDMPDPDARDPHTLVFDKSGNIWFTVQGGNFIGHLNVTSGDVKLVKVPTAGARPYGIKMDPTDVPWIVLFGTNKLATVDPTSYELTEIGLPNPDSRPRRIEISKTGDIYYGDYSRGFLGKYDPKSKQFTEWAMPGGDKSRPYGSAMDDKGHIWLVEGGLRPNTFVGFDPGTGSFYGRIEIPSGGGTVRHMYFHPPTKEIWFGTDTNNIGRAQLN